MWTDNVSLPGMLHLAILRSPMSHARIDGIDASAARSMPGVVDVITGRDVADVQGSLPCAWTVTPDMAHPDHPPLAVDEVRFAGEPVAVVAARDHATALDALEAIEVAYEPLPAVMDIEDALADGSPLVHQSLGTNKSFTWAFDSAEEGTGGDAAAAIDAADVVVRRRYVQQRVIPAFMEPRSVVVDPTPDQITVWSSTQVPHFVRFFLAAVLGTPEHKIRVIAPDVGGGFGGKLQITAEEFISFLVAQRLRKPVKYTESRSEAMLSAHHGRDMIQDVDVAADRDGTVTALRVRLLANMGGYLRLLTPATPLLGRYMYNGIYKFPAHRFECTGVFTTTTPTDAYRGAGRPEATFAIERVMDDLAAELGMDPVELRRRNWIERDEFPFTTVTGLTYDSGDYAAATDKAMGLLGYDELRREQAERRAAGDRVQLGIGVSTYTEMCGLAPSRWLGSLGYAAGGWESAIVRMLPTGKVEVLTGTSPHGQGHETAWSQIVADQLGVPFEDIEVMHGDTRTSHKGLDTYGSRSLAVGGYALVEACKRVVEKARPMAAHLLECDPADLEFVDGSYRVKGTPGASKSITECALAIFAAHDLPDGVEPYLDADASYDPVDFSFPHGTHLCAAEVDTETGQVRLRSYVAVDDIGKVVNPLIVEGQVHGGVAQGIAQALFEEAIYDEDGNLMTGTFVEYTIPSSADLPDIVTDRTETPAPGHPLGAKGVGEAGTIASTPAVVNAVVDALRPYGVTDVRMPCTPERVWQAIRNGGGRP
ncbi:xanthine dehydrogenase family protein molybdopterin-binding subunit [Jiangella asiatica]|uniref:Xanthine dehydrogenase family protein molybdopterin-binding subunit n=2 Tax=Jiangella asiatica TaxID=2530372 RepID=A0A4R5CKI2_9ACTN|nr:xanthine dehydrogenase family protein molybdopterin-binding subunit [Jiangella asiatica]